MIQIWDNKRNNLLSSKRAAEELTLHPLMLRWKRPWKDRCRSYLASDLLFKKSYWIPQKSECKNTRKLTLSSLKTHFTKGNENKEKKNTWYGAIGHLIHDFFQASSFAWRRASIFRCVLFLHFFVFLLFFLLIRFFIENESRKKMFWLDIKWNNQLTIRNTIVHVFVFLL